MTKEKIAAIVLGAGKGSRMKSDLPKVMMPVKGKSMIKRIIETLEEFPADEIVTVIAPDGQIVAKEVAPYKTSVQQKQLGTGNAVLAAKEHLDKFDGSIVMIFGDTPIVTSATIKKAVEKRLEGDYAVVVVGIKPETCPPHGRLVMKGNKLAKIVEFKDATEEERKINFLNSGMMIFNGRVLFDLLEQIGNNNVAGEYYLTDVVEVAIKNGYDCSTIEADPEEVASANTLEELALLETYLDKRK